MATEDGFVEKEEGQVSPDKIVEVADQIGEEGTLASIRSRVPKSRVNPDTSLLEEVPVEMPAASAEVKAKEEEAASTEGDDKEKGKEKQPESKFKTKAAAEKAHAEAEREMHEAKTTAARAEEAKIAAEKETADLKLKLEETISKIPKEEKPAEEKEEVKPPTREERKAQLQTVAKTANLRAIEKVAALDRSLPEYKDQVGEAWAEAYAETLLEAGLGAMTQPEIDKMVQKSMKVAKDAQDAAQAEANQKQVEEDKKTAATKAEEENARVWAQAIEIAGKSGLNMTEGAAERDLFEIIANRDLPKQEFMKAETVPPLKDQVAWVVKQVNERLGKKIEQTDADRRKAREHQERNQPLTRGSDTKPPGEETLSEPVSLASIRQADIASRRARHRGV